MRFAEPNMLWVLAAVLPLFAGFLWWSWRAKERLMAQFVQSRLLASLMVGRSPRQQRIRFGMLVAAVALLLLTLARPQWGFTLEEAHQRGLDIVVVADTSRSMLAEDVTPNRLERAKLAALDLQRVARNDRLGLVVFAGSTFLQCPLTLDEEAFRQSVQVLDANIIEQGGSSLADAIEMAQTAFKKDADNFKVIVLLTDGEDHEGGVMPVVEAAAKKGFRIFTIGVGTVEGELLRLRNEQGIPTLMKDEDGNIVRTRLNESMLQRIATAANGFYLPLQGTGTMETLYERGLAPLPKGDISSRMIRKYFERFQWVLGLAILLLAAEMFLPERERKRQSRRELVTSATTDSTATTAVTALLILSLLSPSGVLASPSSAAKQYQKGEYDGAWTEYQRLLKEGREDARLHFNAGASAYKAGRYTDALRSFYSAQQTDDLQLQQKSYYNQGNAFYQLGEKSADPDETMEHWEQAAASYERALKLDSKDADAQHNLEMVRRKLQQLEQQMENDSNSSSGKGKSKSKRSKNKKPGQNQGEGNDSSEPQPGDQSDKKQGGKKDREDKQKGKGEDEDKKKEEDKGGKDGDRKDEDGQDRAGGNSGSGAREMTPQQAEQLLDAQKNDEKTLMFQPSSKGETRQRKYKNW